MGKHFTSFRVMNINDAGTTQVFLQVLNNIDTSVVGLAAVHCLTLYTEIMLYFSIVIIIHC